MEKSNVREFTSKCDNFLREVGDYNMRCCALTAKAKELIVSILSEMENNTMVFGSISENYEDDPCCITYDGGNHPEYAANPWSIVKSVSLDNENRVCVECEECDCVVEYRISGDDMINLAEYVIIYNGLK